MSKFLKHSSLSLAICSLFFMAYGCSTIKVLQEGERRLTSTKISVTNDKKFNPSELSPYLKQTAGGWNPFLYVYNWENGKGGGWDKFVHKLGTAPVIYDSTLVTSSIGNITEHLEYIGYYDSKVEAVVDSSKYKKAKVKYYVTLGKRYKISDIAFELPPDNAEFSKDFYADTLNCSIRKGGWLSEEMLENESVRSANHMHNRGFYDFSKNYFFFEADTSSTPGMAKLKIKVGSHTRNESSDVIRKMQRYKIGTISLSYPEDMKFREKVLKDLNMLRSGMRYSDRLINIQYSRYSSIPYFNAVNMQLQPREGQNIVDCDIQLGKSRAQGFKLGLEASINTAGLWGISPELSYYHKNIFHGGEVLNISLNTNHQIMHKNTSVRSNEVNVSASLTIPKFFPFPTRWFKGSNIPKTEIAFTYNYQSRPEYKRNIASASFGYVGKYRRHFYYQAYPLSLNLVDLPYIDESFWGNISLTNQNLIYSFMNHLDLGMSTTLYYNNSDNATNPTDSYWYTRLKFDLAGNLLSLFNPFYNVNGDYHLIGNMPYSQYVKAEWEIGKTFVFGKKDNHSLAGRLLIGYGLGYGNSTSLPFEKRFYSGGANSLRGWVARTVGPGTSPLSKDWSIPNQTGDMKLEANLEYRFKIFWKIAGAVFVDAGNIWEVSPINAELEPGSLFSFKTMGEGIAASWGVGLRLDLNFFLLRVDYGMRFHDPARAAGSRWVGPRDWFKSESHAFHFGVGYPF